jgi:hypothetical protein
MVNLEYPAFPEREYKKFVYFSDILLLDVPTGTLIISDYLSSIPEAKIEPIFRSKITNKTPNTMSPGS